MTVHTAEAGFASLAVLERLARRSMPADVAAYVCGGAGAEITLRANRHRLNATRLAPRVLVDVSRISTATDVFGPLPLPVLFAPVGLQRMVHPDGEEAGVRGTNAAGVPFIASTVASCGIERIAALAERPPWFQLYAQRDWSVTLNLVRRAQTAGAAVIVVTVDTPSLGIRDRQTRASIDLASFEYPNLHPHRLDLRALTWRDVERLRDVVRVPLVLKGILNPDDAERAVQVGADGIVVSNHGGRNVDTLPAVVDALPRVVAAVAGRIVVLADGGVRRGIDVLKYVALGADAVLVGRPYLYALHLGGDAGVATLASMLSDELASAMALAGRATLAAIDASLVW